MNAVEVHELHKSFNGLAVLRGLNLAVPRGKVYGLLGANGAGKSTLMHLLLGFLRPDAGYVRVLGTTDLERTRGRVGYLPERLRYHLRYSAREYLHYLGQFNSMPDTQLRARIDEELRSFDLLDVADRRMETYSKGMLQRLGIAQALLLDPELVLIDEPTSGLDQTGQREMIDVLAEVRRRGHTVLLTTHMLHEVEHACDLVGILADGTLAIETEVAGLRGPGRNVTITVPPLSPALAAQITSLSPAVQYAGREISIAPNDPALQAQVLRALLDASVVIIALEASQRPIEELYTRAVRGAPINLPLPAVPPPAAETALPPNGIFAPPDHPDALAPKPAHANAEAALLQKLLRGEPQEDVEP